MEEESKKIVKLFEIIENSITYAMNGVDKDEVFDVINEASDSGIDVFDSVFFKYIIDSFFKEYSFFALADKSSKFVLNENDRSKLRKILEEKGYFFNNNIKISLSNVQSSPLIQKIDLMEKQIYNKEQNSGFENIINWKFEDSIMKITDDTGYTYSIIDLDSYDMDKDPFGISKISPLISEGKENDCHNYAHKMSSLLPEGITITSILPRFSKDNYYFHSYTQYGNYIIDLTMNIMMSVDDYNRLMKPIELSRTKNSEIKAIKNRIESVISNDLKDRKSWSYILFIAILNIINRIGILDIDYLENLREKNEDDSFYNYVVELSRTIVESFKNKNFSIETSYDSINDILNKIEYYFKNPNDTVESGTLIKL